MSEQEISGRGCPADRVATFVLHVVGAVWALAEALFVLAFRLCGLLGMVAAIVWLLIELAA